MRAQFDYKKEYKELYAPSKKPQIVHVPKMDYVAVWGKGDPNEPDGEYKKALQMLYAVSFTIKMSQRAGHEIEGYFSYVVPPLEGLWWQEGKIGQGIEELNKEKLHWISMIQLPDFVKEADIQWAARQAEEKKKIDCSKVKLFSYEEGMCVQCMHIGSYGKEPETIERIDSYARENGYEADFSERRFHHEIYLSDPRRAAEEKLRTVIRHPIRMKESRLA